MTKSPNVLFDSPASVLAKVTDLKNTIVALSKGVDKAAADHRTYIQELEKEFNSRAVEAAAEVNRKVTEWKTQQIKLEGQVELLQGYLDSLEKEDPLAGPNAPIKLPVNGART